LGDSKGIRLVKLLATKPLARIVHQAPRRSHEGTALAAGGAAHLLQAGCTDVQDMAYVSTGVSQSAHQGTQ